MWQAHRHISKFEYYRPSKNGQLTPTGPAEDMHARTIAESYCKQSSVIGHGPDADTSIETDKENS